MAPECQEIADMVVGDKLSVNEIGCLGDLMIAEGKR